MLDRWVALVALCAVLVAGCGTLVPSDLRPEASGPAPTTAPATPTAPVASPSDPAPSSPSAAPGPLPVVRSLTGPLSCGADDRVFPRDRLDAPADAELAGTAAAAALRAYLAVAPPEAHFPASGWRLVIDEPGHVLFLAQGPDGWSMLSFIDDGAGGWTDADQGECRLAVVLPKRITYATWRLDPARLPGPRDTSLHLLATELACASGRPFDGRLLDPIVLRSKRAVTIVLEVRRREGKQDCPGNPEVPVTVRLGFPLGDRLLFDGSTIPPSPR